MSVVQIAKGSILIAESTMYNSSLTSVSVVSELWHSVAQWLLTGFRNPHCRDT